jgi:hypothetical protein
MKILVFMASAVLRAEIGLGRAGERLGRKRLQDPAIDAIGVDSR